MPSLRRRRVLAFIVADSLVLLGAVSLWLLSAPSPLPIPPVHKGDPSNGERLFHAGSCLACHWPGETASTTDPNLPAGGAPFRTPVGTFYPQNLTPDIETGLGDWTPAEFMHAMRDGVSPSGEHYFPAFPYTSYRGMTTDDILDLFAYLQTLRPVRSSVPAADVPALWLARRSVGLWKRLALRHPPRAQDPTKSVPWRRGAYLTLAPGHCGECHTPRNFLMIMDTADARLFAGGPHPAGEGTVPSLRGLVSRGRYDDAADLALALQYGEELGFDHLSSGGMGLIQTNLSRLPESDLQAMAEYLVSLR